MKPNLINLGWNIRSTLSTSNLPKVRNSVILSSAFTTTNMCKQLPRSISLAGGNCWHTFVGNVFSRVYLSFCPWGKEFHVTITHDALAPHKRVVHRTWTSLYENSHPLALPWALSYYEACTVGKRAVGNLLECFLVLIYIHQKEKLSVTSLQSLRFHFEEERARNHSIQSNSLTYTMPRVRGQSSRLH